MPNNELDDQFIAQQKNRLQEIQEELLRIQRGMEEDEEDRGESEGDTQADSGDVSQNIFDREMDATIGGQVGRRLEDVQRALEKVKEGTYGLSDESGAAIPQGRLEAMPEAIRTVDEQQSFESKRRPT